MTLNKKIKILVVEDEAGFAQLIRAMLEEFNLELISIAHSMEEALALFEQARPDICLIAIGPDKKQIVGIALAEKIREVAPALPIIYLTGHYSIELYERCKHTRPSNFMNKELSRLKLGQAIELALMHRVDTFPTTFAPSEQNLIPESEGPGIDSTHFFFKVGDLYKQIAVEEVAFFYANGKMTFARINKRNFPTNVPLKALEEELLPSFLRIHKSYLVNVDYISSISLKENRVETVEEQLPIGYAYRKAFLAQLKLLK